ncbi:MAG: OmpA family protein, partial [Chitinophagales bacterium]|nr:OmpA family protein [Chitinophagales bacterium]
VSDRPGGYGGSDIYVTQKNGNKWTEPKNLGRDINTLYSETYPFFAPNGILYFASDGRDGLGGLDIYKTSFDGRKWTQPENLGAPFNSAADDFGFLTDSAQRKGFISSNRSGGLGSDDIYVFTYDDLKSTYKTVIRVTDALSGEKISNAVALLNCSGREEKFSSDKNGEITLTVKSSKKCIAEITAEGYKSAMLDISRAQAGSIEIKLERDNVSLLIEVKELETGLPLRDVTISLKDREGNITTFVTNDAGMLETQIPSGSYTLFSTDYQKLSDKINTGDFPDGKVKRQYTLSKKDFTVSVPLTANCFSGPVTVIDLRTGEMNNVKPGANGELRLELRLNNKYVIEHNQRRDTINTKGLFPGDEIKGPCNFRVGQKWIVNHVFYDLNKSDIRPDAALQLDNLARVMKENPSLQIELSSHTDCRGTDKYNDILSLYRAQSAINYLKKKGIDIKRLLAAGYGEKKPIIRCACDNTIPENCTEEQHQLNRRTEVKVLKY